MGNRKVAEESQVLKGMQREVARLKRKVDSQAKKICEQDEEIRTLREKLRRYEEAESNNIRDEISDEIENDNMT